MIPSDGSWTRYEKFIHNQSPGDRATTALAEAMRKSRLSRKVNAGQESAIWETATNVIGPFMFSYVHWIMDRAREANLSTIYFVSRDGQILHKVALELEKLLNYNIKLEYIYGSRKAWHLPGFGKLDETALSWILDSGFCSANEVCRRADIQISDLRDILDHMRVTDFERNLTPPERHELGRMLLSSSLIESKINDNAEKLRNFTVSYLKQVGFSKSGRIGVVDIGWRGMLQLSLCQLLDKAGIFPDAGISTFYVALLNECQTFEKEKRYSYFDRKEFKEISNFHLFEIFSSADHGTCLGYEEAKGDGVTPVLKENRNTPMIEWGIELQQAGVVAFSKEFISELSKNGNSAPPNMKALVAGMLREFSRKPSEEEAQAYGSVDFYDDQEERSVFRTATRISRSDAFRYPFARDTSRKYGLWPEGTFRLSFGRRFPYYSLLIRLRHLAEAPLRHQN